MLSEQIRPDVEAAPWVIEKIKELEQELSAAQAEIEQLKSYIKIDKECYDLVITTQALQIKELRDLLFNLRDGATGLWGGELDRCNEALSKTYDESALRKHVAGEINKAGYFANDDFVRAYADRYERNEV